MTKIIFLILFCLSTNFINSAVSKKESQELDVSTVVSRVLEERLDLLHTNANEASKVGFTDPLPSYCEPIARSLKVRIDSLMKDMLSLASEMHPSEQVADANPVSSQVDSVIQSMRAAHVFFDDLWKQKFQAELGAHRRAEYDNLMHDCINDTCPQVILRPTILPNGQIKIDLDEQVFAAFVGTIIKNKVYTHKEQLLVKMQHEAEINTETLFSDTGPIYGHIQDCIKLRTKQDPKVYSQAIIGFLRDSVEILWMKKFKSIIGEENRELYNRLVVESFILKKEYLSFDSVPGMPDFKRIMFEQPLVEKELEQAIEQRFFDYNAQREQKEKEQQKAFEATKRRLDAGVVKLQKMFLAKKRRQDEKNLKVQKALLDEDKREKAERAQQQKAAAVAAKAAALAKKPKKPKVAEKPPVAPEEMQRREQQSKLDKEKKVRCKQEEAEAAALKKATRAELERQQSAVEELVSQVQGQQSSAEQELPVQKPGCAPINPRWDRQNKMLRAMSSAKTRSSLGISPSANHSE